MANYNWQKSSCSGTAGNCIYVAATDDGSIKIRESDEPDTILTTTPENFRTFILGAKAGDFDHLMK